MSRATLRRNGPRSGLSSEASERRELVVGVSGVFFLEREEGEGEGGFLFGSGDWVGVLEDSDL